MVLRTLALLLAALSRVIPKQVKEPNSQGKKKLRPHNEFLY
jgi:hypothetical protein